MKPEPHELSRREREIMDILYRLGEAGAAEVAARMHENPGYDSVRVTLGILAKKGHVGRRLEGRRYLYAPTVPHEEASVSAVKNMLRTFFHGSPSRAILALLDQSKLSKDELDEIATWIEEERESHEPDAE